jgi:hypothetical protein
MGAGMRPAGKPPDSPPRSMLLRALHFYPDRPCSLRLWLSSSVLRSYAHSRLMSRCAYSEARPTHSGRRPGNWSSYGCSLFSARSSSTSSCRAIRFLVRGETRHSLRPMTESGLGSIMANVSPLALPITRGGASRSAGAGRASNYRASKAMLIKSPAGMARASIST